MNNDLLASYPVAVNERCTLLLPSAAGSGTNCTKKRTERNKTEQNKTELNQTKQKRRKEKSNEEKKGVRQEDKSI